MWQRNTTRSVTSHLMPALITADRKRAVLFGVYTPFQPARVRSTDAPYYADGRPFSFRFARRAPPA